MDREIHRDDASGQTWVERLGYRVPRTERATMYDNLTPGFVSIPYPSPAAPAQPPFAFEMDVDGQRVRYEAPTLRDLLALIEARKQTT